ncbi:MAG: signal peptidase I [Ruminococcaceae bacterium]|nr:signal peptidase I [Oscillospiraceae bacterium]
MENEEKRLPGQEAEDAPAAAEQAPVQSAEEAAKPDAVESVYEWLEIFVFSIAFVMLLFTFVMRLAIVDGQSMENTLHDKETLILSNLFYTPEQGDIIVFQSPTSVFKTPLVKRVIATEGQVVDIDFDTWQVTVDGVPVKEDDYVKYDYIGGELYRMRQSDVTFPHTVADGCVFVMGDNRNGSSDSRTSGVGDIDTRFVLGKVLCRIFPLNKIGGLR